MACNLQSQVQRAWNSPATHGAPVPLAPTPLCSAASSAIVAVMLLCGVDRLDHIFGVETSNANLKFHPPCFRRVQVRVTLGCPRCLWVIEQCLEGFYVQCHELVENGSIFWWISRV